MTPLMAAEKPDCGDVDVCSFQLIVDPHKRPLTSAAPQRLLEAWHSPKCSANAEVAATMSGFLQQILSEGEIDGFHQRHDKLPRVKQQTSFSLKRARLREVKWQVEYSHQSREQSKQRSRQSES